MSTRPTSTPPVSRPISDRPRLHEVLATGLAHSRRPTFPMGMRPARSQPGNIAPPSVVESLLDALPVEIKERILNADVGMSCKEIARLCATYTAFRDICFGPESEVYWRWQCQRLGYDRFMGILLVGPPGQPPGGGPWRDYYKWYCIEATDIASTLAGNMQQNEPALAVATWKGYIPIALGLIAAGVNVNFRDNYGNTALILASRDGHLEIVRALLAAAADVSIRDGLEGATALVLASENGELEIVRELIAAHADVNTPTGADGHTALMRASSNGYLEVVQELIAAGADVNATDNYGYTALWVAIGKLAIEQALRDAGATE